MIFGGVSCNWNASRQDVTRIDTDLYCYDVLLGHAAARVDQTGFFNENQDSRSEVVEYDNNTISIRVKESNRIYKADGRATVGVMDF